MNTSSNDMDEVIFLSESGLQEDPILSVTKASNIRKTTKMNPTLANKSPNSEVITNSTATSTSAILRGLGGFIHDYQTLSTEIKRLKNSEKIHKEMLHQKQLELNQASDEWCTAQAEQAKNEMMIRKQEAQINSLQEQACNLRIRNTFWDNKLNIASRGLEAMFQTATNLTKEDETNGSTANEEISIAENPTNTQLLPHTRSTTNANFMPVSRKLKSGILQQKIQATNRKLRVLREKISKRMSEREQTHRELKHELARKRRLLQSLEQLIWRTHRHCGGTSKGHKQVSSNSELQLKNKQGSTTLPAPSAPAIHERDLSIPVKLGFVCICGESFRFISSLYRHLGKGKDKKFDCEICNATFLLFSDLNRHLRDRHRKSFSPNMHGCRTCGAVFPNKKELMKGWKHRNGKCLRRQAGKKNQLKKKSQ